MLLRHVTLRKSLRGRRCCLFKQQHSKTRLFSSHLFPSHFSFRQPALLSLHPSPLCCLLVSLLSSQCAHIQTSPPLVSQWISRPGSTPPTFCERLIVILDENLRGFKYRVCLLHRGWNWLTCPRGHLFSLLLSLCASFSLSPCAHCLFLTPTDQHAGVSGPPRLQLGSPAAPGMLHRCEGMEGTKKWCHGDFTGVHREYSDSPGGNTTSVQRKK